VHIREDELVAAEQDLLVCSVGATLLQTVILISRPSPTNPHSFHAPHPDLSPKQFLVSSARVSIP